MARILVVDDDNDILRMGKKILTAGQYEVLTANDAIKAMDMLNTMPFDLLITDANMPHYSGFELVRTIKNSSRYKNMGIVMLTGRRDRNDIQTAIRAGVDDYIVKPIDPMLFLKKIETMFQKKPPEHRPEVEFAAGSALSEAQLTYKVKVKSVSELGVNLILPFQLEEGMIVDLGGEYFKHLGSEAPPMKVVKINSMRDGFFTKLHFVGAKESFLQKIRSWVYSHPIKEKSVS